MKRVISILSLIALAFVFTSTNAEAKHESHEEEYGYCESKPCCPECGACYTTDNSGPDGAIRCKILHRSRCMNPDW